MNERPETPWPPTEGFESVAEPDPIWRPVTGKHCRYVPGGMTGRKACGQPSAAEMNRGRQTRRGRIAQWWAYCPAHLYGRWVEDGQVMHWILRKVGGAS